MVCALQVASHSKNTVLGRSSIFLDTPEQYQEIVTSNTVELLAVPRSVILGWVHIRHTLQRADGHLCLQQK